jgi:phospholipid/cholesterol/gamma-HCH transport system substrate-binding protein
VTRRTRISVATSPVLVGAVTTLVTIVAVFLAYNANQGLPFVPTYDVKAELPNAANLVKGNDVRIGGTRVGIVDEIEPVAGKNGETAAKITMKLEKRLEPLPVDSTLIVRPRSALGLKYVEITPGSSRSGFRAGDTVPIAQATPRPVEIDEVLNAFDDRTREGSRRSLVGFGDALAGRGRALNEAIAALRPLLPNLQAVTANLADPRTRLGRFVVALRNAAGEAAPVAETQAALFVNLDITFSALAQVARPFIQETISRSPPALDTAIAEFPRQRPFLRNTTAFARELRPGVRTLPVALPDLADALEFGVPTLKRSPSLSRRLARVFDALARFAEDPIVPRSIRKLTETAASLKPTLRFLTPVQTTCNYATLWFRNISSLLSEGDSNGTWQRFIIISAPFGPNNEGGPSSAPANGPDPANFLHSNPYPNTASPGQPKECESGNEDYLVGQKVIGNLPGTQSTKTSGQEGGD